MPCSYIAAHPKHSLLGRYWNLCQWQKDRYAEGEEPSDSWFIMWDWRNPVLRRDPVTGQKRYEPYDYLGRNVREEKREAVRSTFKVEGDGILLTAPTTSRPKVWRTVGKKKPPKSAKRKATVIMDVPLMNARTAERARRAAEGGKNRRRDGTPKARKNMGISAAEAALRFLYG